MFDVTSFKLPDGTKTAAPMSVAVDTDGVSAFVYWGQQGTRSGTIQAVAGLFRARSFYLDVWRSVESSS
jgi:hypothetical protein